jgi:hypothetical protein
MHAYLGKCPKRYIGSASRWCCIARPRPHVIGPNGELTMWGKQAADCSCSSPHKHRLAPASSFHHHAHIATPAKATKHRLAYLRQNDRPAIRCSSDGRDAKTGHPRLGQGENIAISAGAMNLSRPCACHGAAHSHVTCSSNRAAPLTALWELHYRLTIFYVDILIE